MSLTDETLENLIGVIQIAMNYLVKGDHERKFEEHLLETLRKVEPGNFYKLNIKGEVDKYE